MANYILSLPEELLGRTQISLLREHGIHKVAIPVYGTIQVAPFTVTFT
jgi:hypothetical protein